MPIVATREGAAVRMITDRTNREGLTSGNLVDWIETLAMAPLRAVAVCAVVLLATRSSRQQSPRAAAAADRAPSNPS